jgi:hypothetical protein
MVGQTKAQKASKESEVRELQQGKTEGWIHTWKKKQL